MCRWWWWKYGGGGTSNPGNHSGNLHCDRYWHFRRDYEHGDDHAHGAVAPNIAGSSLDLSARLLRIDYSRRCCMAILDLVNWADVRSTTMFVLA